MAVSDHTQSIAGFEGWRKCTSLLSSQTASIWNNEGIHVQMMLSSRLLMVAVAGMCSAFILSHLDHVAGDPRSKAGSADVLSVSKPILSIEPSSEKNCTICLIQRGNKVHMTFGIMLQVVD